MTEAISYYWRDNAPITADPQVVGKHLMALAQRLGRPFDAFTPDDVIEDARDPSSPLHSLFQWDNMLAAEQYRRVQARLILGGIRFRVEQAAAPTTIAFVNVRLEGQGRAYVPTTLAMRNTELARQVRADALHGLQGWQRRYRELSSSPAYQFIEHAIDALAAELEERPALPQDAAA